MMVRFMISLFFLIRVLAEYDDAFTSLLNCE